MIARNVSSLDLVKAAEAVGVKAVIRRQMNQKATAFAFTLKLGPERLYQRTSPMQTRADGEPRRIAAVCWHGHAAFFRELFKLAPDVTISSSRMGSVKYTAENFEQTYGPTGDWNIGSMYNPVAFRDACDYDTHPVNKK